MNKKLKHKKKDEISTNNLVWANCSLCRNESSFDKESLKASTHIINGVKVVLCVPCEDDLLRTLVSHRISKERMEDIAKNLMSEEREDLMSLYPEIDE